MSPIWIGIEPGPVTKIIAIESDGETILKARLESFPAHPRALQWLCEALALWQGNKVHAAIDVAKKDDSYVWDLSPDPFGDLVGGPLYTVEFVDSRHRPRRRRGALREMGDFRTVRQLRLFGGGR